MTGSSGLRPADAEEEGLFGQVADEFFARARRGEEPSVEEFAERFPAIGEQIRSTLPVLLKMEQAGDEHFQPPPTEGWCLGEYRVIREIGRGGMGVVYEAVQETLGRRVALKVLPAYAALDPQFVDRFRREAQAAAALNHPHIVPVFGVGQADQVHYFAMQFIEGRGLDELIGEARRLWRQQNRADDGNEPGGETLHDAAIVSLVTEGSSSLGEYYRGVARIGLQVAEALAYAHGHGVLHRDLKPANLLLDSNGKIWVADFGLCKVESSESLTQTGQFLGTLRYIAPEGLDGTSDVRSDVYGLGITLYELLTLRCAFGASKHAALAQQVQFENPQRPSRHAVGLPPDLETIVLAATRKDPAERYATADAMAGDLRAFLENRPIAAKPPSLRYLLGLTVRRHKALSATIVLSLTTVLALVVLFVIGLNEARLEESRERSRAELRTYEASLKAAQAALGAHEYRSLASSLELAPSELRDWEWHHFQAYVEQGRKVIPQWIPIALHPDGKTLLTGMSGHQVGLFDPDGSLIRSPFKGHTLWLRSASFSIQGDRVVTASADKTARVWDVGSGECLRVLRGHEDEVQAAQFSPDGQWIATGSKDFTVRIWHVNSERVRSFSGHTGAVLDLDFGAEGRRLATASADGTLRIWPLDADAGDPMPRVARGHDGAVTCVDFSPDGTRLVSGSQDRTVRIWDADTGRELNQLEPHDQAVQSVVYSKLGVVSGSINGLVRFWNRDGSTSYLHPGDVQQLVSSADGTRLYAASGDRGRGGVSEWSLCSVAPRRVLRGGLATDNTIGFSPDGRRLAAAGRDGLVRIFDVATGLGERTFSDHGKHVWRVCYAPDGRLATFDSSGLAVVRRSDGAPERTVHVPGAISDGDLHPDGHLAFGATDGRLFWWDSTAENDPVVLTRWKRSVTTARFSPGGKWLVAATRDGVLHVFESHTIGSETPTTWNLSGHGDHVRDLAFHPDGRTMASSSQDRTVRIWDLDTRECTQTLELVRGGRAVAFHPGGHRIAVATGGVSLWSFPEGNELATFEAKWAVDVDFSPDGGQLAATTQEGDIVIWTTTAPDTEEHTRAELLRRTRLDPMVETLFARHHTEDAVVESIESTPLSREDRASALALASIRKGRREVYVAGILPALLSSDDSGVSHALALHKTNVATLFLSPVPTELYMLRGFANYRARRYSRAIADLRRARALMVREDVAEEPLVLGLLALAHQASGSEDLARAVLEELDRRLDENPDAVDPRLLIEIRDTFRGRPKAED